MSAEEVLAEITQRALVQKSPLAPTETDAAAPCRTARPSRRQARKTEAAMSASSNTEYAPDGRSDEMLAAYFAGGVLNRALEQIDANREYRRGWRTPRTRGEAIEARVVAILARELRRLERTSLSSARKPTPLEQHPCP
jgi:hypothetical protein